MGLLTAFIAYSVQEMIHRGRTARAEGDLSNLAKASIQLGLDTSYHINKLPYDDCVTTDAEYSAVPSPKGTQNEAIITDTGLIGLRNNSASAYPNWKGPYIEQIPTDPWGNAYMVDPDYDCSYFPETCDGITTLAKVFVSGGPNGSGMPASAADYDEDNIVVVLCSE